MSYLLVLFIATGASLAGILYGYVVIFGIVPGARVAASADSLYGLGVILAALGQLYIALIWGAMVVGSTQNYLASHPDLIGWVVWVAAFLVSSAPTHWIQFCARYADDFAFFERATISISAPLADLGFFALVFWPDFRHNFFGWVPTFFGS